MIEIKIYGCPYLNHSNLFIYLTFSSALIDEERSLLGDNMMELGRIFKAAYDDPLSILLGTASLPQMIIFYFYFILYLYVKLTFDPLSLKSAL